MECDKASAQSDSNVRFVPIRHVSSHEMDTRDQLPHVLRYLKDLEPLLDLPDRCYPSDPHLFHRDQASPDDLRINLISATSYRVWGQNLCECHVLGLLTKVGASSSTNRLSLTISVVA
ncbi:hypothetical protein PsorP6_004896 [Peronosclerospora sorghi]|uniref:Uncharacterized protein n=1 Tax=Peronosclerospora sorghi TaxID=230839 RepID=A0ACC0W6S3_9STRA|nr:hypothetical protein PsorP6_004896 [Peronosclerospora sorghi]